MSLSRSTMLTLTINDLLLRYPSVVPVLNGFGIDSCCGGAKPLGEVIEGHRLDADLLLGEIAAVTEVVA